MPSGVDADTGEVPGEAVGPTRRSPWAASSRACCAFRPRAGWTARRARDRHPDAATAESPYTVLDEPTLRRLVPRPGRWTRTNIASGACWWWPAPDHFLGAPVLCAGAAARIGSGLVTVASTRDVRANVAAHLPEVDLYSAGRSCGRRSSRRARARRVRAVSQRARRSDPGLGRGPAITEFVEELLSYVRKITTWFSTPTGWSRSQNCQIGPSCWGRTPSSPRIRASSSDSLVKHPQKQRRCGPRPVDWQSNGTASLSPKAPSHASRRPMAASPSGRAPTPPWPPAAPATSSPGSAAGLLAQGLEPWDAARLAVGVHGLAADRVIDAVVGGRSWPATSSANFRGPGRAQSASMTSIFQSPPPGRPGDHWRRSAAG